MQDLSRGSLHLAITPTFTEYLVAPLVERFGARHPGIELTVSEMTLDRIVAELGDDGVDLGIAFSGVAAAEIDSRPLFQERLTLVVGRDHPYAGAGPLAPQQLQGQPLALLTREFATRQSIDAYLAGHGVAPRIMLQANSISSIVKIVRQGRMATLLPDAIAPRPAGAGLRGAGAGAAGAHRRHAQPQGRLPQRRRPGLRRRGAGHGGRIRPAARGRLSRPGGRQQRGPHRVPAGTVAAPVRATQFAYASQAIVAIIKWSCWLARPVHRPARDVANPGRDNQASVVANGKEATMRQLPVLRRTLAILLPALALAAVPAHANLVANGSFETVTASNTDYFYLAGVSNWSNSDIGETLVTPSFTGILFPGVGLAGAFPANSPDGGNFVLSDGDYHNSPIVQTISGLTPGNQYKLSFYQALAQDTEIFTTPGPVRGQWQVNFGGDVQMSALMSGNGATLTFSPWAMQSMSFTAHTAHASAELPVGRRRRSARWSAWTGVNIAAVPEPDAVWLLGIGGLLLGWRLRARRAGARSAAAG